jgi:hypothetical protein
LHIGDLVRARFVRAQLTRVRYQVRAHGPLQHIAAGRIDGKYRVRGLVLAPGFEGVDPAVFENVGRGIDTHSRTWARLDIQSAVAMPLGQPERTPDGHDAGELRQPDECEELPKQPAHGYSFSSW